jgi:putative ATPase
VAPGSRVPEAHPVTIGGMEDLFSSSDRVRNAAPLAARMRPRNLDEVIGQTEATGPGSALRRLVDGDDTTAVASVILWGPPGCGKTTIAMLAARSARRRFVELSATSSGVADLRKAIDQARNERELHGRGTVLFVDEIHRFSKTQQDALLPAVERGWVVLVAATTENPSFSVVAPLLSRSLLVTLRPLDDDAVRTVITKALGDERGLAGKFTITDDAVDAVLRYAHGDVRRALTAVEAAAGATDTRSETAIGVDDIRAAVTRSIAAYDRDGDQHYDVISAFIKSMRGSDADAALHYLARMIASGEDPRFIARRLVVHASEDVGMADPSALLVAVAAANTVALVGMPEARLALAQATIHIALAPKSNAVIKAIDAATADVERGRSAAVPAHLRDGHYAGAARLGHGIGYQYPHDFDDGVVAQQYLPEPLQDRRYYTPTAHGAEAEARSRWERLRTVLRRGAGSGRSDAAHD